MTQDELRQMLNLIVSKCDNLINNNLYTADDFTQCNVEDIAETCNRALDGHFGKLPSALSNLDEAARKYGFEEYRRRCEGGKYGTSEDAFKAGAEYVARESAEIEKSGYNRALKAVKEKVDELYDEADLGLSEYDSGLFNGITETCMKLRGFIKARLYLEPEED